MRKILFALLLLNLLALTLSAQVKIGDNPGSVNARSLLELESTNKGLLMPRMTNSQIAAMTGAPTGMLVFSSTDSALYLRRDTGWAILSLGNTPSASTNKWASNGNNIYSTNTGNVGIGTNTPITKLDVNGDTLGLRRGPGWDNLWFTTEDYKATINASGADSGVHFRVGANATGIYGNGQTLNTAMTLLPNGSVGMGTTTPNASAALDITATNKGLLVPRYTTAAISNIAAPAKGLLVYDSTLNGFYTYTDTGWLPVGDNLGNHTATQTVRLNNNALTNNGTGGLFVDNSGRVTMALATITSTNISSANISFATIGNTGNQYDFLMNTGSNNVGARKGYGGVGINYQICVNGVFPSRNRTTGTDATNGMDAYLGEIMLFAGNYTVQNWMPCDGRLLQISQYQALYAVIGTNYGGNGQTTFALPDLRASVPVGIGTSPFNKNWVIGEKTN